MNRLLPTLFLLLPGLGLAEAAGYDVIVRNGTIYDGTAAPTYVADIAISGDRLAALGDLENATATLEIDASGLAVAPGFINLLSHAHLSLLKDGRAMSDVMQGVTFEVLSETSLSPLNEASAQYLSARSGEPGIALNWTSLNDYLERDRLSGAHPRAYGNVARLLGRYVRDAGVISLEQAIHRLTLLPAQTLSVSERGRLAPGFYADITIFDPDTIEDRATFENAHQYATGIRHVLVNGIPVIADAKPTGATPGRAVRGPGWVGHKRPAAP